MLNFLSSNSKKQIVGFSLTPGIGLEAVILDKSSHRIINYGRKKVDYNFAQRNVQNYGQFKTALVELIDEMKIPSKTYAYLILPNVYFDFIEIAPETSDDGIDMALTSTSEEYYIFKKEEPIIGWCEIANAGSSTQKKLAYSAFQKSDINEIREIFSDVGLELSGIETAYSATLKGLYLTGLIDDAIMMNSSWSALLINTNSFTLFKMEGKNLLDCNEIPLAIKSFSAEEAYQAIVSSASQLLARCDTSQLYIISQTEDISANALKRMMQFDKEIIAIDSNKYSKKPLLEVTSALDFNDTNLITLSAIGASDINSDFGLNLNILNKDPNASMGVYFQADIMGQMVDVTKEYVQKTSIGICLVAGLVLGGLAGATSYWNTLQVSELDGLNQEISRLDSQIAEASKSEVKEEIIDMTVVIDEIAKETVNAINFYDSISTDIPKNVWLTKYYNQGGDRIAIRGIAESIIDIYEYYKNLRIVAPQSDIRLTELKVITNPNNADKDVDKVINSLVLNKDVDRLYSFEIANTSMLSTDSKDNNGQKEKEVDESIILSDPFTESQNGSSQNIEQPSQQMTPAR